MNMKIRKYLAIFVTAALVCFVLSFINAFMGNPISKALVNYAAKKYIEQHYFGLNLTMDKAFYNFKDGKYHVNVKSTTSIDTHFSISFTGTGKFIYDDYKDMVLSKWNTFQRLDTEYRNLTDIVLENEDFPYESDIAFGEIMDKSQPFDELEIDKEYDIKELGKKEGHIVLYVTSNMLDAETLAQTLVEVKSLFDQKKVPFYSIDLTLQTSRSEDQKSRESIQIQDFLYQDIYAGRLQERVQENVDLTRAYYEQRDKEKDSQSSEQ
ncbi:hypothetical protein [Clostridium aminobutyricum]|uniref:DUF3139 domain-containing protein n=1 Tax=Clostridium aminobutyricum TaxID=33953 RepID=A0A939D835_CLOAM|nr:hypothetical protein [Clostridium aminobutyricum]MBN7772845.1 hypothetical protein [Clostridium aminobutyricum]